MIKGQQIKERSTIQTLDVDYRKLPHLNCSMIKLFDKDPIKFFQQFKLGRERKDIKNTSLIIGDIVDFYILECRGDKEVFDSKFDDKFSLYKENKGTGQVYILTDILFDITKKYTNKEGVVTTSFDTRFKEAIIEVQKLGKYSGKSYKSILKDFNDNAYEYFTFLIENDGKIVVDISLLDKSKKVANILLYDEFTKDIFHESENEELYCKLPIEWVYKCSNGDKVNCKSEIDILRIDHTKKVIYLKDLKTSYNNEEFEYGYLNFRYDLQAAFYFLAVKYWSEQQGMDDYSIDCMEFVVGDTSSNARRPILYRTSPFDLDKSLSGFSINGFKYRGIHQLMDEINWAEKSNNWNVSKELFNNEGKININVKYD